MQINCIGFKMEIRVYGLHSWISSMQSDINVSCNSFLFSSNPHCPLFQLSFFFSLLSQILIKQIKNIKSCDPCSSTLDGIIKRTQSKNKKDFFKKCKYQEENTEFTIHFLKSPLFSLIHCPHTYQVILC